MAKRRSRRVAPAGKLSRQVGRSKEKIRRKGLMLGADLRVTFLSAIAPVVHPTFHIGYEAF